MDETAFFLALGIDLAEDGELEYSYQLGVASTGPDSGGDGKPSPGTAEIISIKAPSSAEARNLVKSIIAPSPDLSHAKLVVVSEKVARRGVEDVIAPLVRFREYRGSMFVVVCRGPAKEFLKTVKPKFAINPTKYYEGMMGTASETSFFPKTQLHNFYIAMKDHSSQPYAAYAAVNPATGEVGGEEPVPGRKSREYIAGSIPRSGGTDVEFAGTAVFSGDKMVGVLTTQETRALAILTGRFPFCYITVQDPLAPKAVVMGRVALAVKPKIKAVIQDGRPVFDIDVTLEGETLAIASGINYEKSEYRTLLQQQISNVFEEEIKIFFRKTQGLNADVAGMGYRLRSGFSTVDEFDEYDWKKKYQSAVFRVHVKTILRRSGLMRKSSPIAKAAKE